MNGLSVGELCCLFCCPPFPSRIVAKLAFLPPPPTYKLIVNGDQTYSTPSTTATGATHTGSSINGSASTASNSHESSTTANGAANSVTISSAISNTNTQATATTATRPANANSGFIETLRNSTRRLCSSFACTQSGAQQQHGQQSSSNNNQLLQQLHTNAKLIMLDKVHIYISFDKILTILQLYYILYWQIG